MLEGFQQGLDLHMRTSFEEMAAEAMKLPLRDRVRLAQQLATSLDDQVESDVEELWLAEAERRLEELRTGKAALTLSQGRVEILCGENRIPP